MIIQMTTKITMTNIPQKSGESGTMNTLKKKQPTKYNLLKKLLRMTLPWLLVLWELYRSF